jgi:hypothetical protein
LSQNTIIGIESKSSLLKIILELFLSWHTMRQGDLMLIKIGIGVVLLGVTLAFQNCGEQPAGSSVDPSGVSINCAPSEKPCLKYRLRISNLKSTKQGLGVLLQGDVNEGVLAEAHFSPNCQKTGPTLATCPFNQVIKGTITSNAQTTVVKGDGRSLSIEFSADETRQNSSSGTLGKPDTASKETRISTLDGDCLDWDGSDEPIYNGIIIPFDHFKPCEESDSVGKDLSINGEDQEQFPSNGVESRQ